MKFWQKAFVCVIALFLLGFDMMGYILAERSYAINRDYALAAAETEYEVIKKSLSESVRLSENNFTELNPANLDITVRPYADFYHGQGIYLQIYGSDDSLLFNNAPFTPQSGYKLIQGERLAEMKTVNGSMYCFVASHLNVSETDLLYIYVKDMRSLVDFKANVISDFITVGVFVSLILAGIILFMLIGLTRPFRRLNAAADEISKGNYSKRVDIKSRDEIGEFANSFNLMADHIVEHITELSRMTESKQNFIDNLAHEIRTPITAIVGYGELLQYANYTDNERQSAIRHIISQGKRIQNMSFKLLDLSYTGSADIKLSPVKLEDVLANSLAAVQGNLTSKNINVGVEAEPVTICGDAELLESLFVNLLDNAIAASENGTDIEIRVSGAGNGVSVEISDCGKGIEPKEIPLITEPFYRVDKSRSGKENHAGLGISLCARICEIHNASFEIFSELGQGTTAKILFTTL